MESRRQPRRSHLRPTPTTALGRLQRPKITYNATLASVGPRLGVAARVLTTPRAIFRQIGELRDLRGLRDLPLSPQNRHTTPVGTHGSCVLRPNISFF
jgi:hypothetical protein